MICSNCNKKNRTDSKFCRFCGSKLGQAKVNFSIKFPDVGNLVSAVRKQNKKTIAVALLVVITGTGTAFAAPKISDYIKVNGLVSEALELESAGDYQAALASLVSATDKWTLESKQREIEDLKEAQARYAQYKKDFESALEMEEAGKLADARELLRTVEVDYPEYGKVEEKINELQEEIENNLREQARAKELEAQRQAAAAAEARRQAQAEAAAKARAEAERAASEAQARASAEAARQAEIRRQQEEAERAKQVRISFLNQLANIYSTFQDGNSYYNNAMSYYNSGSYVVALAGFGQAQTAFQNAYSSAQSLQSSFTGMSDSYTSAASNAKKAAYYALSAIDEIADDISSDYCCGNANYYSGLFHDYASKVGNFLSSQGY